MSISCIIVYTFWNNNRYSVYMTLFFCKLSRLFIYKLILEAELQLRIFSNIIHILLYWNGLLAPACDGGEIDCFWNMIIKHWPVLGVLIFQMYSDYQVAIFLLEKKSNCWAIVASFCRLWFKLTCSNLIQLSITVSASVITVSASVL